METLVAIGPLELAKYLNGDEPRLRLILGGESMTLTRADATELSGALVGFITQESVNGDHVP